MFKHINVAYSLFFLVLVQWNCITRIHFEIVKVNICYTVSFNQIKEKNSKYATFDVLKHDNPYW